MNVSPKLSRNGAVVLSLVILCVTTGGAQTIGESRRQSTRQEIERSIAASERAAASAGEARLRQQHQAEAARLRLRLEQGDFAAGDRILLTIYGDSVYTDTLTLRADRMLRIPGIPDMSLAGVLASELETHLTKALAVYYKEPRIDATPLVRVSIQGAIARPGFYVIPVDQALPDLIMAAGGPGGQSDLDRATVRRGSTTVLDAKAMRLALSQGKTIGDVSMREGDILYVPDKTGRLSAQTVLTAVGALTGLIWAVRWGLRSP